MDNEGLDICFGLKRTRLGLGSRCPFGAGLGGWKDYREAPQTPCRARSGRLYFPEMTATSRPVPSCVSARRPCHTHAPSSPHPSKVGVYFPSPWNRIGAPRLLPATEYGEGVPCGCRYRARPPRLSGGLHFLPPGGQPPHRRVPTPRQTLLLRETRATAKEGSGRPDVTRTEREVAEEDINGRGDEDAVLGENPPAAWSGNDLPGEPLLNPTHGTVNKMRRLL